jgi:hypothetical protein
MQAWERHQTVASRIQGLEHYEAREELLKLGSIVLDGASELAGSDPIFASNVVHEARTWIDSAADLTPGVGLVKDLISIRTGVNPVTGEAVGATEKGILAAGILVPGALKGAAHGVTGALRTVSAAIAKNGRAVDAAKHLLEPLRKAEKLLEALRSGAGQPAEELGDRFVRRLAQAADHSRELVDASAQALRNAPGTAIISGEAFDSARILRGSAGNAGLVPHEVAAGLVGKEFQNFNEFRKAFWMTVADTKYGAQFSARQLGTMRAGQSPFVQASQYWGQRQRYELHHLTPIQHGGSVYDLSNILICTPRFHKEVLDAIYHFKS